MLRSLSRRLDQRVQALTIVNKDDITDCKKKKVIAVLAVYAFQIRL
jgi:hypothetical protein